MNNINGMKYFLKYLLWEEDGQGFVEYSMVAVLISIVAVMLLGGIGETVTGFYDNILAAFVVP